MDKEELKATLMDKHSMFVNFIANLTISEFSHSKNEKWTAGQQLEHILLAVKPVRQALSLPKYLLKVIFGKANRPSKTNDALIEKYLDKLKNGGRATRRFTPKTVDLKQSEKLIRALTGEVKLLCLKVDRFTESDLDKYILPHPLLGKLTVREMLYFTIYHVQHHQAQTERNLHQ